MLNNKYKSLVPNSTQTVPAHFPLYPAPFLSLSDARLVPQVLLSKMTWFLFQRTHKSENFQWGLLQVSSSVDITTETQKNGLGLIGKY